MSNYDHNNNEWSNNNNNNIKNDTPVKRNYE